VISRTASAQIIIVHARQIIMDEGVGVDALDSASERHRGGSFTTDGLAGGKCENRADAFAAGKDGVAHRFVNGWRLRALRWQKFIERRVDALTGGVEVLIEVKHCCENTGHARFCKPVMLCQLTKGDRQL